MDPTLWDEARAIARRLQRHGASDAAEDLAQELALAALEDGGAVERPAAWLERVGRNAAIDRWRAERRRHELAPKLDACPPVDPESALLGHERRSLVRRAVASLPRPQRRAALLRFHGELSFDAVAQRLATRPATARTRVHRALASLRAKVQALRALLVWPGAPAAALALTFIVANADALAPPVSRPAAIASEPSSSPAPARHFARTRMMAAAPSGGAGATPRAAATARPSPPPAQRFDFDDDEVNVDVLGPDGIVRVDAAPSQPSLIELRRHFVPEMLKSLEDL